MNQSPSQQPSEADLLIAEASAFVADEPSQTMPPPDSGTPVVRGAVWTIAGYGIMQILRFGCNLALTRLVEKYVFGVTTTVNLCIQQGLHMFSDLGVRQCVVNSPRGDEPRFLNTAWTVQVIRGFVLLLLAFAIAWPLGWFFDQPEMYWLVPLVGLTAVCDGFTCTAVLTMSRQLQRGALVIREIGSYCAGLCVILAWLLILRSNSGIGQSNGTQQLLAIGCGIVIISIFEVLSSFTLIPGVRNQLAWDPSAARELMHYGSWIFVSTGLTFFANNLDRLYVGKISQTALADYNIAAQLARASTMLVAQLGHQFLFPLYGKLSREGTPLSASFPQLHTAMTGFAAFLVAGMTAAGPTFVWLVFSANYHDAGDYVRLLSIAAWFTILQTSSEAALMAQGRTRQLAIGQAVKLVLLLPLLIFGHHYSGMIGVIGGYTIAEAARYVVLSVALAKHGLPVLRIDLTLTLLICASVGLAVVAGPYMEGTGTRWARFGPRFAGEAAIVIVVWAGIVAYWWPRCGHHVRDIVYGNKQSGV
jgi:O-antigen/teichoic acid export membrane protein